MMARLPHALLLLCLAALASCGNFDLLNPVDPPPPDKSITWSTKLGGGFGDVVRSMLETSDGGFIFLGTRGSNTSESDLWLIKTDSAGVEQWSKTFGGASGDTGSGLQSTSDGGYILVGSSRPDNISYWDVYLVKTKADGSKEWEKTFGGSADDHGYSVRCLAGGYIIAGSTSSQGAGLADAYLIKVDGSGNLLWEKTFGGLYTDEGYSVREAADGGFIIAGYTQASFNGDDNAWLIKTDANGNLAWQKVFGQIATSPLDSPGCLEQGKDALPTSDGYLLAGHTHSQGAGDFDAWLIKTDSAGEMEWSKTLGGNRMDQPEAIVPTADGGWALAGISTSYGPWEQAWLVKTDAAGNLEWEKHIGGGGNEYAYCLRQTADEGYVLAGYTTSYGGQFGYLVYYKPWIETP